ncbi:unnamed protein product, partial [Mesorhabditis spiculigera]
MIEEKQMVSASLPSASTSEEVIPFPCFLVAVFFTTVSAIFWLIFVLLLQCRDIDVPDEEWYRAFDYHGELFDVKTTSGLNSSCVAPPFTQIYAISMGAIPLFLWLIASFSKEELDLFDDAISKMFNGFCCAIADHPIRTLVSIPLFFLLLGLNLYALY